MIWTLRTQAGSARYRERCRPGSCSLTHEFMCVGFGSAWSSAGRGVQLVQLSWLQDAEQPRRPRKQTDWVALEQKRRTFWPAYCLDRFFQRAWSARRLPFGEQVTRNPVVRGPISSPLTAHGRRSRFVSQRRTRTSRMTNPPLWDFCGKLSPRKRSVRRPHSSNISSWRVARAAGPARISAKAAVDGQQAHFDRMETFWSWYRGRAPS